MSEFDDARHARLDEYDADEWYDLARTFKPDLSREEFDVKWAEFETLKRAKIEHGSRN
jgi:hypothetical protein